MLDGLIFLARRAMALFRLTAPIEIVMHNQPATLVTTNSDGSKRKTTLRQVLDKCPSLYGNKAWYTPTLWLSR